MIIEQKQFLTWVTFPTCEQIIWRVNHVYLQASCKKFMPFFVRRLFFTKVVDLKLPFTQLYKAMPAKARYQTRRAEKDSLHVSWHRAPAIVVELFNLTARAKKLNGLTKDSLPRTANYLVSQIEAEGIGVVATHYYLLDEEQKRVQLRYNCSAYRKYSDSSIRSLCGRSNKLLFLKDIHRFQTDGYHYLDFGGYEVKESGLEPNSVSVFKDALPGYIVKQYNYYPIWYYLIRQIRNWLQQRINRYKAGSFSDSPKTLQ